MASYLVKSGAVCIKDQNQLWEVDTGSGCAGLYRQNAATFYQELAPYLILARSIDTGSELFYLVKCKNHPRAWVQVDPVTGSNVHNILK